VIEKRATVKPLRISGTANANLQNKINISGIFNYIREHGLTYRARIARDLRISAPAVSRAIDRLMEDGYVIETTKLVTVSGKRPTQLRINPDKGIILGVDLIKERIKIAVSDFSGQVTATHQGFSFDEEIDVCRALVEEIDLVLSRDGGASNGSGAENLRAVGIGIPAIIDIDTGAVVDAPLYTNLRGVNLKKELEERFHVPVFVENVVKLSALGEKQYGEGRNYKDIIFIEISDGIGAGIILDDHLVRGYYGSAGEIGFSIIGTENLNFVSRNKGFLEKNASFESIREKALEECRAGRWRPAKEAGGELEEVTPAYVCEAARSGDGVALGIVERIASELSVLFINLILMLNPQIVVIGGDFCGLPHAQELFIEPIAAHVRRCLPFQPPKISLSTLGGDAGIIGASHFAISSLLLNEFPYTVA
jgi:predicted NBD/HSP70 family sugar kinase